MFLFADSGWSCRDRVAFGDHSNILKALDHFYSGKEFFIKEGRTRKYEYRKDKANLFKKMLRNLIKERFRSFTEKTERETFFYSAYEELNCILTEEDKKELMSLEDLECFFESSDQKIELVERPDKLNRKIDLSISTKKDVELLFSEILKNEKYYYDQIQSPLLQQLFTRRDDGGVSLDFNVGLGGVMEEYFHTIADPVKYGIGKFSKILNYYWIDFFVIIQSIFKFLLDHNLLADMQPYWNKETNRLNYEEVLKNLSDIIKWLYDDSCLTSCGSSYYAHIAQYLKQKSNIECIGIATTNYYRFCENIFMGEASSELEMKTAYLNGQLKWFELPEDLDVIDLRTDSLLENKLIFPFIFGQSMVKPIIHSKQINEFGKLKRMLESADCVIILGYGINEDDKHINAFLHEYLSNPQKRLLIVEKKDHDCSAALKLKVERERIEYVEMDNFCDNLNTVNKIFEQIKISQ